MYEYIVKQAAGLWIGTDPHLVTLDNEYLRGQVELILELGIAPYFRWELDIDQAKASVARDIREQVV